MAPPHVAAMSIIIADIAPRVSYTVGGSAQSAFTVPFPFFEDADLVVYNGSTLLTLTTNYTVTGELLDSGGTVTLNVAVTNTTITIVRDVPNERVTDFPTSGPLQIPSLNMQFDKVFAVTQQLEDQLNRAVILPDDENSPELVLPSLADRANKYAAWDSAGNFIGADAPGGVGVSLSTEADWTAPHDWMRGASAVLSINPLATGVAKVIKILPLGNYQAITTSQTVSGLSAAWAGSEFTVTDATTYQNFGPLNSRINVLAGWASQKIALSTSVEVTGARSSAGLCDVVGHVNNTYATGEVQSGGSTNVGLFGFNHLVWTSATGTNVFHMFGGEINVAAHASAPVQSRVGMSLISSTVPSDGSAGSQAGAGVAYDNAITISKFGTAVTWGNGLRATDQNGGYPFDTNSKFISSSTGTCGWGLDFQNITFTQYAILSTGFSVDPDGDVVVKSINSTSSIFKSNGTQVLQGRETGWTNMTGTSTKGGFDTATVTLPQLAQVVRALVAAGMSHGFIGA